MRRIVLNGKFYAGDLNGVHRVADRLIVELDRLVGEMPAAGRPDIRLIVPRRRRREPAVSTIAVVEDPRADGQRWEQTVLPRQARGAVLVSLCNLAPLAHRRQLLMIHDAQFRFPDNGYAARARWGYRLLIPMMARASARVLTVSHYSRAMLDLTGVSPADHTDVLHNGVDHILDAPADHAGADRLRDGATDYVLTFGSTKGYKNLRVVFAAMRDPRLATTRLLIVGDRGGGYGAGPLDPPANARFLGPVEDAVLRALYEGAICLAFPSRTEGFGLPPMEAMLAGCPALVAPAGAMPETCRDAATYADVDDPGGWAEAILALAGDPVLRAAKIDAGRRRAAGFTWARAGAGLLAAALALAAG